jgi:hypothetical protein
MLEDAGTQAGAAGTLASVQHSLHVDEHRLPRGYIIDQGKTEHVQGDTFRGEHVFRTQRTLPGADHQGPDTEGVAETQYPIVHDQAHCGITPATALVNRSYRGEDILRTRAQFAQGLHLVGEYIQQYFGVGVGVQVTQVVLEQLAGQLFGVGQVAVMRQGDAVGRVHVKRLGQGCTGAAGGGIAHVADADTAAQLLHMVLAKHITHQALALALAETTAITGHDTGGVLAPVLEHGERVVNLRRDIGFANDSNQATHALLPL